MESTNRSIPSGVLERMNGLTGDGLDVTVRAEPGGGRTWFLTVSDDFDPDNRMACRAIVPEEDARLILNGMMRLVRRRQNRPGAGRRTR